MTLPADPNGDSPITDVSSAPAQSPAVSAAPPAAPAVDSAEIEKLTRQLQGYRGSLAAEQKKREGIEAQLAELQARLQAEREQREALETNLADVQELSQKAEQAAALETQLKRAQKLMGPEYAALKPHEKQLALASNMGDEELEQLLGQALEAANQQRVAGLRDSATTPSAGPEPARDPSKMTSDEMYTAFRTAMNAGDLDRAQELATLLAQKADSTPIQRLGPVGM